LANYGLKISKDGVDVKTATDDQLVFTTKYSMLKIAKVGTLTFNFTTNYAETNNYTLGTVAHGFDYTPAFITYFNFNYIASPYSILPLYLFNGDIFMGNYTEAAFTAYTDSTNIVFRLSIKKTGSGKTFAFNTKSIIYKYYIFADPGA